MQYNLNFFGSQTTFDISLNSVHVASDSLIPKIWFNVKVMLLPQIESPEFWLSSIFAEVSVDAERHSGQGYIGTAIATRPYMLVGEQLIALYLDLDYYKIQQIEKIRKGDDFKLNLNIRGAITGIKRISGKIDIKNMEFLPQVVYEFSKSTWIEKFLKGFNFKHVRLFEFPEVLPPESLNKAMEHLDEGWSQFSSGHYDKVLVDCRKVLEEISTIVMKAGFKRMDKNGKGEDIEVPDWQKIFESDNISDAYKGIFKKLFGFIAPGAHTGKSINNEDALFALMITHALIYYLVEKYPA